MGGAGLDVFEGEELIKDELQRLRQPLDQTQLRQLALCHSLLRRDDVILTPHVAFFTREGVGRLLEVSVATIRAYLAGKPEHLVPGLQA
ncbi:D-lactate dehydrogenase [compost metagenome]